VSPESLVHYREEKAEKSRLHRNGGKERGGIRFRKSHLPLARGEKKSRMFPHPRGKRSGQSPI